MIDALVLPADSDQPIRLEKVDPTTLSSYQTLVGGNIELVRLEHPPASMWINEDGKNNGLPLNARASAIAHVSNSLFRQADVIVGDAFVVGDAGISGWDRPLPVHYLRLVRATKFIVRSKIERSWFEHNEVYTEMWAAYAGALAKTAAIRDMQLMVVPTEYAA